MIYFRITNLIVVIAFIYSRSLGQETHVRALDDYFIQILEDFIENNEGSKELEFNTLLEGLEYYLENPLNLNKASYEELKELLLLSDIQIHAIIEHIDRFGPLLSILELQSIPSIDLKSIRLIQAFVTVGTNEDKFHMSLRDMIKKGKSELFLKQRQILESQKGYIKNDQGIKKYEGDPNRVYLRYKFAFQNRLRFGITAEKDPGEAIFSKSNRAGFDFYSSHFHIRDFNLRIKDLILGDYSVSLGQGLILHNNFGASKSAQVMNVKKGGRTLKAYGSINEINFFRGFGTTLNLGKAIEASIFGSFHKIDGNIIKSDNAGSELTPPGFSSIVENGLHRTDLEIQKENTVFTFSTGTKINWKNRRSSFGMNLLYTSFDKRLDPNFKLYNQFQFRGKSLLNISIDYSHLWRNFNLFGEIALSDNGSIAQIHGALIGLDKKADLAIVYRNYGVKYQSLNSNSFGETTGTNNENGVYIGVILRPIKSWTVNAYADLWKHNWLRFRADAPSTGSEYFLKLEYVKKRKIIFYIQYKLENKAVNSAISGKIDQLTDVALQRIRFHVSHKVTNSFELRNRVEFSFFENDVKSSAGFMIYQDLLYRPIESAFRMTARVAIFDTDDFDTRIYAFENDLVYEYFIPYYQYRGMRYYINLRYDINRSITAECRIAQTYLQNRETIGSGNDLIAGNKRTELKTQLRIKF